MTRSYVGRHSLKLEAPIVAPLDLRSHLLGVGQALIFKISKLELIETSFISLSVEFFFSAIKDQEKRRKFRESEYINLKILEKNVIHFKPFPFSWPDFITHGTFFRTLT